LNERTPDLLCNANRDLETRKLDKVPDLDGSPARRIAIENPVAEVAATGSEK
jgi:hypothetical protein